jgi:hypothetical protein
VPVFGGLLIIYQKGEPLIFQEEMSDQVETLTLKKIVLSKRSFVTFWGKIENPSYYIAQLTPERDEVVYPRYLQLLFNYNGIRLDQLSFLTVRSSLNDASNKYLEIVDTETLLLEFGGWVYTLKCIK